MALVFVSPVRVTGTLTGPPDVDVCRGVSVCMCVKVLVNLFQITVTRKVEAGQQQNLVDSWQG